MSRLMEGVKTMNPVVDSIGKTLWRSGDGTDAGMPE
jgi:hypothetical protein